MTAPIASPAVSSALSYCIPEGVRPIEQRGRIQLTTPAGGRIWIDQKVLELWKAADQKNINAILADKLLDRWMESQVLSGLACLAEAGLLQRSGDISIPKTRNSLQGELVSVIIVSYNSRRWLKDCLSSIASQSYGLIETIIVDNASQDGSAEWIQVQAHDATLIALNQTITLAKALNFGIQHAAGRYLLLLNPDVILDREAVYQLIRIAQENPSCAAVAAKLQLLWAPSFLNGLGNLVGPFSWGTDIGLGHLDLGQFDHWKKIPSACFAAALIPKEKMEEVGILDEGFSMYYEDSEWCYRARLLGYSILAAPHAKCLHAFGSEIPSRKSNKLSEIKLRRVSYGRLRFITRINGSFNFWRFLLCYLLEDILHGIYYLLTAKVEMSLALFKGWRDYLGKLSEILNSRRDIQSQRQITDRELFSLQKISPVPLIQSGLPVLTWDVICNEYRPLISAGATHHLPEFSDNMSLSKTGAFSTAPFWRRAYLIWKYEGAGQAVFRAARQIHWWLVQH